MWEIFYCITPLLIKVWRPSFDSSTILADFVDDNKRDLLVKLLHKIAEIKENFFIYIYDNPLAWKHFGPFAGNGGGGMSFVPVGLNRLLNKQSSRQWFLIFDVSFRFVHCRVCLEMACPTVMPSGNCSYASLVTWAHFTYEFSIVIQIRWKIRSALVHALLIWWLWNFAHNTTAVLSWHMQNFVTIWYLQWI